MVSHPRELSEQSTASYDSALSEDARLARRVEDLLARGSFQDSSEDEDEDEDEQMTESGMASVEDERYSEDEESSEDDTSSASRCDAADIDTLCRSLSVHSQVTTTSSFAERMEKAQLIPDAPFIVIGRGTCGTVFEIPGTGFALKKGPVKKAIWGDSQMTNLACKAVGECKSALEYHFPGLSIPRVPRVQDWVRDDDVDAWWSRHGHKFTNGSQDYDDDKRGHIFCVQRIPPLPEATREALMCQYFPAKHVPHALVEPENRNCLVRPYLGQRRTVRELERPPITLQNYPLYLDQLLYIRLPISQYAQEMAIGLAVVHWRAGLDGMDMEFVIGSCTSEGELASIVADWKSTEPFLAAAGDGKRRTTHLWVLDFDKAEPIDTMHDWQASCSQMVTAVTANDPYYPNPVALGHEERAIWDTFEQAYIKAARVLLKMDYRLSSNQTKAAEKLPKSFIEEWKKVAQKQMDAQDGGFIEFG